MARRADWQDTFIGLDVASGAQSITSLMGNQAAPDQRGVTVVRSIFRFHLIPPTAASDGYTAITCGIGVVSQEGFAAGVVPDPQVMTDRPPRGWLFREMAVVTAAASMVTGRSQEMMGDLRGKRKVDNGELVVIFNSDHIGGTAFTVTLRGIVRTVFLLP